MTPLQLIQHLTEKMQEAGGGAGCTIELRHDRELMVFDTRGMMVGEPIELVRGPEKDVS